MTGPMRYTHAAARMREGICLTADERRAMFALAAFCMDGKGAVFPLDAAARVVDKLRRGLELYRVMRGM